MVKKKESSKIEAPEIENPIEETQVAELDEREKDLSEREEKLAEREKAVSEREAQNEEFSKVLEEKEKDITEREEAVKLNEQSLEEREKEIEQREKILNERKNQPLTIEKETENNSDVFEFEGGKYRFIPDAPLRLKVLGIIRSQQEIIKDEEALLHLIGGKCALIEKID